MKEIFFNQEIARLIVIIITSLIIFFPLFVHIKVRIIYYQGKKPIVRIMVSDLLKIKLDYQVTFSLMNQYSIRKIKYLMKKSLYIANKYDELIKKVCKKIKITKLTIVTSYQNSNPIIDSYLKFGNLMIYQFLDNLLNRYFNQVTNDYYRIINHEKKEKLSYEMIFSIRGYQIIQLLIGNFSKLKELRKEF